MGVWAYYTKVDRHTGRSLITSEYEFRHKREYCAQLLVFRHLFGLYNFLHTIAMTSQSENSSGKLTSVRMNEIESGNFSKNLVLCFDGTDGNFGPDPFTNILKIYRMLDNSDDKTQMCYYQPGVGTSMNVDTKIDVRRRFTFCSLENSLDSMFAFTLDQHVISAYHFLMNYYEPGDKIFMFGFSRGAFLARILAGMVERVGLLSKGSEDLIGTAWKMYQAWEYAAQPSQPNYKTTLVEEFKNTFSRDQDIKIHFQGLFDSVNSVGILRDRLFPYTSRSRVVDHVRHAVSLDERRGKFKQQSFLPNPYKPSLFSLDYKNYIVESHTQTPHAEDFANETRFEDNPLIRTTLSRPSTAPSQQTYKVNHICRNSSTTDLLHRVNKYLETVQFKHTKSPEFRRKLVSVTHQRVEGLFKYDSSPSRRNDTSLVSPDLVEKWFPGDHSDVGGGWPPDIEKTQFFSSIPLRWMIAEAIKHGVIFKKHTIREFASKYTSCGSLTSLTHDLLSFSGGKYTMGSPLKRSDNPPRKEMSLFRGLGRKGSELIKFFRRTFVSTTEENVPIFKSCNFSEETVSSVPSAPSALISRYSNDCEIEITTGCDTIDKRNDGRGSESIFHVIMWWIVELIPVGIRIENSDCEWRNVYIPNLGRHRHVPQYGDLHWSVYWRIKHVNDYRPGNLPLYANNLIDEFEGIHLGKKRKDSIKTTISSPLMSYPEDESQQLLLPKENCACIHDQDRVEEVTEEARELLKEWSTQNWKNTPDDLAELLNKYPDL